MARNARDRSENTIFRGPVYVSHFVIFSVVSVNQPKNVSFRSFHGVFAQRCRILGRVASVPQKNSRHRRESGFFRAKTRGTAGRTLQKSEGGAFWTARRGPKVAFFARYRGPKTLSAPQENPPSETVRQKWSEIGLQNINCAPFFGTQTFFALFRTPVCLAKNKAAQKRHQTRNPQKRSVFAIFAPRPDRQKPEKTHKTKSCKGARSESKNAIFSGFGE